MAVDKIAAAGVAVKAALEELDAERKNVKLNHVDWIALQRAAWSAAVALTHLREAHKETAGYTLLKDRAVPPSKKGGKNGQ